MRKQTVYRISVVLSAVGLAVMFFTEPLISPEVYSIEEIDESMTGEPVKIEGQVGSFNAAQGHIFLDFYDNTGTIDVVEFDSDTWIDEEQSYQVQGYVDIYEGDLQIIAEEIREV